MDVGFDNPIFAMLELEYTEADQDPSGQAAAEVEKKLTFYELDLGLNHVVRKWSEPVSRTGNKPSTRLQPPPLYVNSHFPHYDLRLPYSTVS